uniref:Uncharacterized protein n=1 Tax=Cacopsylla melanoneura TaxID=428564 RepID=A0A8D8V610_9HEMI
MSNDLSTINTEGDFYLLNGNDNCLGSFVVRASGWETFFIMLVFLSLPSFWWETFFIMLIFFFSLPSIWQHFFFFSLEMKFVKIYLWGKNILNDKFSIIYYCHCN